MNIPSSSLKDNITVFFQDCEELLAKYKLKDFRGYKVEYKFTRKNDTQWTLSQDCNSKIEWILVRNHFEEEIKKLESINPCVDNLIEYFGLASFTNDQTRILVGEENIRVNKDWLKWELTFYFFEFKRLQDILNISIDNYVTFLLRGAQSEIIYYKTIAQLMEFKTNLEQIEIQNFTIRKPTDEELNRIINDNERNIFKISNPDEIASVGSGSMQSTHFWIFMESQQTRYRDIHVKRRLYQQNELDNENDTNKIRTDFKKLILALRLYNGNCIGIRSFFINSSFVYENRFEPWREYQFLNSEFGHFRKSSYSLHLNSKEIFSDNIKEINALFEKLTLYELNPLEQIDRALEHFFDAFEQNYPVYTFTELIMSFETLFNEKIRTNKDEKIDLIREIREANSEKKGLSIFNKYQNKNSIHRSTKMLNELLHPGINDKNLNKYFYDDQNKNGCYQIRNNLLHGNLNLDSAEMIKKIPKLVDYVKSALLKIIDLRISNELNCNEENYFKKLNEVLKI